MATKAMYPMNSSHYDLFFVVTVAASSRGHCPYVLRTSLGRKSLHDARNWLLIPCPDLLLMMPIQLKTESERKEERKEGRKELSAFLLPPMFFHLLSSFSFKAKRFDRGSIGSNISETTFSRSIGIGNGSRSIRTQRIQTFLLESTVLPMA